MLQQLDSYQFAHPAFLLLLLVIPAYLVWQKVKGVDKHIYLHIPDTGQLPKYQSWRAWIRKIILPIFRWTAFALLIIVIARPQLSLKEEEVNAEGIDIFIAMDVSSSMLAQDFKPNRLEVSKQVAAEFVDKRPYDRIGLTVFAAESYTYCPLTSDHEVLKEFLSQIECGILKDGTAIGMGLATGVNRLKDSQAKSKVLVLLTDGVNNAGYIKPMTAAEIAQEYNVKVYTIGIGSVGKALVPSGRRMNRDYVFRYNTVRIDEDLLREIASATGGKYYRSTNEESLKRIYAEIDRLEKTKMEVTIIKRYSEEFRPFLSLALILFCLDMILRNSIFRTLP